MRNKVVVDGDISKIRCTYVDKEVWVKIDTCFLDIVCKEFMTLGVQKLRCTGAENLFLVGEYQRTEKDPKQFRMKLLHRFLLNASRDEIVTFIDDDGTNCTMDNMELIPRKECIRRSIVRSTAKNSKYYTGVQHNAKTGKFTARIKVNGKAIHLGTFEGVESAIEARKRAEKEYWGW